LLTKNTLLEELHSFASKVTEWLSSCEKWLSKDTLLEEQHSFASKVTERLSSCEKWLSKNTLLKEQHSFASKVTEQLSFCPLVFTYGCVLPTFATNTSAACVLHENQSNRKSESMAATKVGRRTQKVFKYHQSFTKTLYKDLTDQIWFKEKKDN
jgi:hypothetical protein